ncbi:MAG: Abi-alpha family protein [Glycocaulis sp.]
MAKLPVEARVEVSVGKKSVDKLIDAVVDAFSPATEFAGMLGDAVRLARVDMAARITRRAKEIADENGLALKAPPLKFLVPFYEKASLENDEDEEHYRLFELWAALLANASAGKVDPLPLLSDAISKLSPRSAKLLEDFCDRIVYSVAANPVMQADKLAEAVNLLLNTSNKSKLSVDMFAEAAALPFLFSSVSLRPNPKFPGLIERLEGADVPAGVPAVVSISKSSTFNWGFADSDDTFNEASHLNNLNILKEFYFDRDIFDPDGHFVARHNLSVFALTPFGYSLYVATRTGPPPPQ